MQEWWENFYNDIMADILLHHDPAVTDRNAAFILDLFRLAGRSVIFDQCAGQGDLSIALARRGMRTIGVEQAVKYVETARQKALVEKVDCHFETGDANRFVTPTPCDAAVNWYTSFGYSAHDSDNILMLQRAYDSLKPGGQYVLDYLFPTAIVRNFQPRREYETIKDGHAIKVERLADLDFTHGTMNTTWVTHLPDGQKKSINTLTRLYAPHELGRLAEQAGFEDITFLGDNTGRPLSIDSPRCIALMRKPEVL